MKIIACHVHNVRAFCRGRFGCRLNQNKINQNNTMIKIHTYTATWDAAMSVKPQIRSGTLVKIHQDPDARELNSFGIHLAIVGKQAEKFIRTKGKFDFYIIKKIAI